MAITTTTLSAAVAATAREINVTSATGFAAGSFVQIDQEWVRVAKSYASGTLIPLDGRGLNGTVAQAHVSGANVSVGTGSDFANPAAAVVPSYPLAGRNRSLTSVSATGTLTNQTPGTDAVVVLNGTNAITLTLSSPSKDMDGDILIIIGNGKAAHVVVYDDFGDAGNSYDALTFAAGGRCSIMLMAINGIWTPLPSLLATATNVTATFS